MKETSRATFFSNISFYILLGTIILLPFFFMPFVPASLGSAKGVLLAIGSLTSLLFWVVGSLARGSFVIPRHPILFAGMLLPVAFLIAGLFSPSMSTSLWGTGFQIGTFSMSIVFSLILFLSTVHFSETKRVPSLFSGFLFSFLIVSLFQLVGLFVNFTGHFPKLFAGFSSTLVGSVNELALFFTLSAILSLLAFEILQAGRGLKIILGIILGVSVFFLMLVNFLPAWILFGIFALLIFVYSVSNLTYSDNGKLSKLFPLTSFITVLVCLLFILANGTVGTLLPRLFGLNVQEVRPSIAATANIARDVFLHRPLTGIGPNRFTDAWSLYKPDGINGTQFWDARFESGFGLVPTYFVTLGIIGFLAWIFFYVMFVWKGIQVAFAQSAEKNSNFWLVASFLSALFGWIVAFIYVPSFVLYGYAFIFTGAFVAQLISRGYGTVKEISFLNDPRSSFFGILALMFLIIVTVWGGFVYTQQYVAEAYVGMTGNYPQTVEGYARASQKIARALALHESAAYHRALSSVYVLQFNVLLNQKNVSSDAIKPELQNLVNSAEAQSLAAIGQDKKDAINWVSAGSVYEALMSIGIENSYENARDAYNRALIYTPGNPGLYLNLARLSLGHKDTEAARGFIDQALKLKGNYTDAYFLLAQIEVAAGNLDKAIAQAEKASLASPNDATVSFQLGILAYNAKSYTKSIAAFERAVLLSPSYVNARYFLGLAYYNAGRADDALTQFKILKTGLPDNEDIAKVVSNLNAGLPPLGNPAPVVAPEKDKKLPIKGKE